jgi:hypothetical protein
MMTVFPRGSDPPYPPMSVRAALIAKNAMLSGAAPHGQKLRDDWSVNCFSPVDDARTRVAW